ncbi:MAG: glucosaminidase domain-containing protein [Bacteroidetes bacterium]|nr:glucosaminidase domain-containing protein [Bacteroidota bacterium]MBS1973451.1 glucosaminidase domain-containing protein [Bacteroidota bacterium]
MRARAIILVAATLLANTSMAQSTIDIQHYIDTYKDLAVSEMERSGVPASIILAQGIHETEAGASELVKKSNNHFGIKCKDTWTGGVVYHDDDSRGECFRSYDKPEDSYRDHSDFLRSSQRYAFLFKLDPQDYKGWAYGLKKAGYATNIRYAQVLIRLIEDYNLQQYTLIAMGKIKADEDSIPALAKATRDRINNTNEIVIPAPQAPKYPEGEFMINNTKVIFVKAGTSLLAIAGQYGISLSRLVDFNDLKIENVLEKDQLLFLQRKRKISDNEYHVVQPGESLYDIAQEEGVRYHSLLEMNQLENGAQPAIGEKIYLQSVASSRPMLAK